MTFFCVFICSITSFLNFFSSNYGNLDGFLGIFNKKMLCLLINYRNFETNIVKGVFSFRLNRK